MKIEIDDEIYLSPFEEGDASSLMQCLNNPRVNSKILSVPNPYTIEDSRQFINSNSYIFTSRGNHLNYAIRNMEGNMIGSIGLELNSLLHFKHSGTVAYYVDQAYWGKNVASRALKAFLPWCIENYRFKRLTAHVFSDNPASEKVLQKCGFSFEATLKKFYLKDGEYIDTKFYSIFFD